MENVECSGEKFVYSNIQQLIDLAVTPNSINSKYLHAVLHLFSSKLYCSNITIELAKKDAEHVLKKFSEPKTFKFVNGNVLELCEKHAKTKCIDYLFKIPNINQAFNFNFFKPPLEQPANIISESSEVKTTINCIENRLQSLEKSLNLLIVEFKEYEKCQNINQLTEINNNEIHGLRKHQVEIIHDLEELDDRFRCMEKQLKIIENQLLELKKIRDIVKEIDKLVEWQKTVHCELENNVERFELLKTIKADRSQIQKLNDQKANKKDLMLFTTLEIFSCVQNDLYTKMNQLHERLYNNETLWTQNFQELQEQLKCNISKADLGAINIAIHKELFMLNKKLKKFEANCVKRRELHEKYLTNIVQNKICTPVENACNSFMIPKSFPKDFEFNVIDLKLCNKNFN